MINSIYHDIITGCSINTSMNHTFISRVIIKCQFGNFIFIIRDVITQCPVPIFCRDRMSRQSKFNTFILQCTYIRQQLVTKVCTGRSCNRIQQIISFTIIQIKSTCQFVVQYTEIQSNIVSCSFFPFQVFIISLRSNQ